MMGAGIGLGVALVPWMGGCCGDGFVVFWAHYQRL